MHDISAPQVTGNPKPFFNRKKLFFNRKKYLSKPLTTLCKDGIITLVVKAMTIEHGRMAQLVVRTG
jgi:hypothetical protein